MNTFIKAILVQFLVLGFSKYGAQQVIELDQEEEKLLPIDAQEGQEEDSMEDPGPRILNPGFRMPSCDHLLH